MERNYEMELLSIIAQMGWEGAKPLCALLVGVPGVAKTQVQEGLVEAFQAELRRREWLAPDENYEVATFVLPQTSPDALEGGAVPNEDRTELNRLPLAILRRVNNAKFGMVFGDELSSGSDETGAAFMTFAQDGRAGDLKIPDTIARVFAMNPADCAAAGRELSPPEANRFCWIPWSLRMDDWVDYMRGGKGVLRHVKILPEGWESRHGSVGRQLVAAFIQQNPQYFNELDVSASVEAMTSRVESSVDNYRSDNGAWSSPRSLFNLSRAVAAIAALGEDFDSPLVAIAARGFIGDRAGEAFHEWIRGAVLPNPEDILKMNTKDAIKTMQDLRSDEQRITSERLALAVTDRTLDFTPEERFTRWHKAAEIMLPILEATPDTVWAASKIILTKIQKPGFAVIRDDTFRAIYENFMELGIKPEDS